MMGLLVVLFMKKRFLLLCWLFFLPLSSAADTILIVGDSLSAAYGMPVEQGWVALLRDRLAAAGRHDRLVNSSISGDTTANALARIDAALARYRPDVVILELGGNDGLRGLAFGQMKQNLAAMIERIRQAGAQVLLVGVQLPPNYGRRYTERFEAVYRQLAQEQHVPLLPSLVEGIGVDSTLMQADGIHPNARAQPLIAERVWQALKPLLGRASGPVGRHQ